MEKETIELLNKMIEDGNLTREAAEKYCPELKESEDDRIRKELLDYCKNKFKKYPNDPKFSEWIAWIEKQEYNYTFEIKGGHWYKCVCDYMLNGSDLMFKNDRLYYCRSDWRLVGEIDERNVKNIGVKGYKSFFRPATNQEIKDWLKKQGEQKFNVGDWVVSPNGVYWHVDAIRDGRYQVSSDSGESADWPLDTNIYHKFTIQDAKDGDVLAAKGEYFKEYIFIYSKMTDDNVISTHCGYDVTHKTFDKTMTRFGRVEDFYSVCPATKEQRELLFKKMKEAGYEWDSEKKELRKIEQKQIINYPDNLPKNNLELINEFVNKFGRIPKDEDELNVLIEYILKRQKPAWSEELGSLCLEAANLLSDYAEGVDVDSQLGRKISRARAFLIDLYHEAFYPSTYNPRSDLMLVKSAEWSEEDEKHYKSLLCLFECVSPKEEDTCWFKTLKDRVQPQQEWSEEDIVAIDCAVDVLSRDLPSLAASIGRLKSLRPQSHWKPSKEQMGHLLRR